MEFSDYFVNLVLSGILTLARISFIFSPNAIRCANPSYGARRLMKPSLSNRNGLGCTAFCITPPFCISTCLPKTAAISTKWRLAFGIAVYADDFFWLFPVSTPRIGAASTPAKRGRKNFCCSCKSLTNPPTAFPACTFPLPCSPRCTHGAAWARGACCFRC